MSLSNKQFKTKVLMALLDTKLDYVKYITVDYDGEVKAHSTEPEQHGFGISCFWHNPDRSRSVRLFWMFTERVDQVKDLPVGIYTIDEFKS